MKRYLTIGLTMAVLCSVSGCGTNTGAASRNNASGGLVEEIAAANGQTAESGSESRNNGTSTPELEKSVDQDNSAVGVVNQENTAADSEEDVQTNGGSDNSPSEESSASEVDSALLEDAGEASDGIDVDLTKLSSTMVYSEVYNMMAYPDQYIGKTINMEGVYTTYYSEEYDKYYFACIIQDATACCAQGIEFVLDESYSYPEDYPEEGAEVMVCGTFDLYEEDGFQYCTLRNASMDVL